MSGAMWADPDHIRGAVPRIEMGVFAVQGSLTTLKGKLDGEGACWGADETGTSFSTGYLPAANSALEAIAAVAEALTAVAAGLNNTADAFEAVDESNAGLLGGGL